VRLGQKPEWELDKGYGNPSGKHLVKATHKSPGRIRYGQSHPTVSIRLSSDVYDLLQQRLKKLGVLTADFIKEPLGFLHTDIEEIKDEAGDEGYN